MINAYRSHDEEASSDDVVVVVVVVVVVGVVVADVVTRPFYSQQYKPALLLRTLLQSFRVFSATRSVSMSHLCYEHDVRPSVCPPIRLSVWL